MKATLQWSSAAALGGLALAALAGCDAGSPPGAALPGAAERAASAPAGSLTELLRDRDPYARARGLGALLPTLGPEAVPEVVAALGNAALEVGAAEHELLVRFWASQEPQAALVWATDSSPTFYRDAAILTAFPFMVKKDLQASLVALDLWERQRPDVREAASRGLVLGWYEAGHPGLTQYIHDLDPGFPQQVALVTYLRAVAAREGVQAIMDWAESLPDEDAAFKLAVYRQVASALPLFDRASAMRWCDAHCDGPYGNNLRGVIAGRWMEEDGPGAFEWLRTAPEGHERDVAIRTNFAAWSGLDAEAALAWMTEQTRGGELPAWLEPALPVYAVLLAESSPTAAIEWAQRIEKDVSREMTLIKIARRWRESDRAAAEAWLEASPLSAEAREQVRDPNRRKKGTQRGNARRAGPQQDPPS